MSLPLSCFETLQKIAQDLDKVRRILEKDLPIIRNDLRSCVNQARSERKMLEDKNSGNQDCESVNESEGMNKEETRGIEVLRPNEEEPHSDATDQHHDQIFTKQRIFQSPTKNIFFIQSKAKKKSFKKKINHNRLKHIKMFLPRDRNDAAESFESHLKLSPARFFQWRKKYKFDDGG